MKNIIIYFAAAFILLFKSVQPVFGLGIGLIRQDSPYGVPAVQTSYSSLLYRLINNLAGIDVIMDTAVAKNRLFNYRLSLECYSAIERKDYLIYNYSYSLNRVVLANTFGFGFVRTRFLRVWAGPQLAISYEFRNAGNNVSDSVIYNKIGSVVGINFHMGEETTLSFEVGFRAGLGFDLDRSLYKTLLNAKPEPIASVRLIFRTWDSYVPSVL